MQEDMADVSDESKEENRDIASKTFTSAADGYQFYNRYALEKGFSMRRNYVEWDGANKEIVLRKLVCSREGRREEKHMKMTREDMKRWPRNITRVGCKAKLVIPRVEETWLWFVKDFIDEHTHPLAPADLACLLRSHRGITDEMKEMETSGICKHKIMDVLRMQHGGFDKVGCTTRDIYNFCHLYKQETIAAGDAQPVMLKRLSVT
jgi:zinc finger SWIM domain-containing protein 3